MSNSPVKKQNVFVQIEFETLVKMVSKIVSDLSGIVLGPKQFHMVEGRLKSRMLKLGLTNSQDYYNYLIGNKENESQSLLSLLTTHHTYFFREFSHFEFIETNFDQILITLQSRGIKTLRVLVAACSRGHEAYSISIFLDFLLKKRNYPVNFEIKAFDIDHESVSIAKNGVYDWKEIQSIPHHLLENNWKRGTGEISNFGKIIDLHKNKIEFKIGSLFEIDKLNFSGTFDLIFCRNVFIYFTEEQIRNCISGFLKYLHINGYMVFGISEALTARQSLIETVGPSIYRINRNSAAPVNSPHVNALPRIKVMIVDDSPSLVTLMKKIITSDSRFELITTCKNGKEAFEFLKTNTIDVMTLDIHMPELDGVNLLKTLKKESLTNPKICFPKTIMVSSVSREDSYLVGECLENGAVDFVEKPSMDQLLIKSDEIITKIKSAFDIPEKEAHLTSIETSFSKNITLKFPEKNVRLVFVKLSSVSRVVNLLKTSVRDKIKTVFVFDGAGNTLEYIRNHTNLTELGRGNEQFQILDFQTEKSVLSEFCSKKRVAIYFQSAPSQNVLNWLQTINKIDLYISFSENLKHSEVVQKNLLKSNEVFPVTSFYYMATKWSSEKE